MSSSFCPLVLFAVAIVKCSFPATGHSKGKCILLCPVAFFDYAVISTFAKAAGHGTAAARFAYRRY
jgi:hypothetical protein